MSKNEIKTEAEQDFSIVVPVEGYPGLFTYKDDYIPDMELVPLEGYPGLFTYRPLSSE